MSRSIWKTLGIDPTNDAAEIKRAYARRLKQVHPEDDPEGFQALRAAYDQATQMARNGWAVPRPVVRPEAQPDSGDFDADDADDWSFAPDNRWTRPPVSAEAWPDANGNQWPDNVPPPSGGWAQGRDERWSHAALEIADTAPPEAPDEVRAELARERERAEAHKALCDALSALVSNPDGDRQEALSAMLRVLRSPGMDSLDTHSRTERWLAHLVTVGGRVVDDMVEPLIHYFDWNNRQVGVDLSHAVPVLQRRDAGIAVRRLERKADPDHRAWLALRDKPGRRTRLRARLSPGFTARVLALLERIERELPDAARRLNPEAVAWWRAHQERPQLDAVFLWIVLTVPFLLGGSIAITGTFGEPRWSDFLALWTVLTSGLLGAGLLHLHGVVRPRLVWRAEGPWHRPLWQRFGWAGGALALPLLAGLLPLAASIWGAVVLAFVSAGLWGWARVASSHMDHPGRAFDWGRYISAGPLLGWLLLQSGHTGPAPLVAALGAAIVLQTGCDAIADEVDHLSPPRRRGLFAGLLGLVGLAGAGLFAAGAEVITLAGAAGLVAVAALVDRALSWAREAPLFVARRVVLLVGWIGGLMVGAMLPMADEDLRIYVGLGLWLLAAAVMNAVPTLLADVWPGGRGRSKRKPGDLA